MGTGARLGALGVAGAILGFAVALGAALVTQDTAYDWRTNMLSDLGDPSCHVRGGRWICSPGFAAFNASLMGIGALLGVSALLLLRRWGRVLAGSVAVMGVGLVLAGVFPAGDDGALHLAGVVLALVVPGLGLLLAAIRPQTRWLVPFRVPRGILAVVALVFCGESRLPDPLLPRGVGEWIIVGCLVVALLVEASRVLLQRPERPVSR